VRKLLLATNNPGKVREFRRLLCGLKMEILTPAEAGVALDVAETGATYQENAELKAMAYARAAGCLALADDSGLEVDALDGQPGALSARFGGDGLDDRGRYQLLLRQLDGVPEGGRTARFRAVVAIAGPDLPQPRLFEGVVEGSIGFGPAGDGGFGYDPVFLLPSGKTAAEQTPEEKDASSHRGKAVRAARAWLETLV
jgi:XTP/dITP diphosphohydrolase